MSDEQDEKKDEATEAASEKPATEPAAETTAEETPAEEPAAEEPAAEEPPADAKAVEAKQDALRPGMTVRVHEKIEDVTPKGEKRIRVQIFEGLILGIRGAGISKTMTVRKVSGGIGVEKIYPISSPVIAKVEVVKTAKVRRAKLSFLTNPKKRFRRKLKETWNK